jgi:hypothetical protein
LEEFLEMMSTALSIRKEKSHRVVPVTEMFAHIGGPDNKVYRALADAGRLNDFFDLAQGYFARGIEKRLKVSRRLPKGPQRELTARAVALAGSLLSLLRWWLDSRRERASRRHGRAVPPDSVERAPIRLVAALPRWHSAADPLIRLPATIAVGDFK